MERFVKTVAYGIFLVAATVALFGCQQVPVKQVETVYVDKPIPYIPKPPDVPSCLPLHIKSLTDTSAPGDVVLAYHYDMTCLTGVNGIQTDILNQYRNSSSDFSEVQKKIDALYKAASIPAAAK